MVSLSDMEIYFTVHHIDKYVPVFGKTDQSKRNKNEDVTFIFEANLILLLKVHISFFILSLTSWFSNNN